MVENIVLITTTLSTAEDAQAIARKLVGPGLAACVQVIGPIKSFYTWKGKAEEEEEWLCLAKSLVRNRQPTIDMINQLHPYQTPEIVATGASAFGDYLQWMKETTRGD